MALIKLELPAGIYSNGTDYESSGRWNNANLVRWQNNSIRPVGGWVTRVSDVTTDTPRAAHAWLDNSHDPHLAVATNSELYAISYNGTVSDITPSGFSSGSNDASENISYGGKAFGTGDYGVTRPTDGVVLEATT